MTRIPTHLLVSALLRRADQAGGSGVVIARGDRDSGAVVILCRERGRLASVLETGRDLDGRAVLRPSGPGESTDERALADWGERRRRGDPDLWMIELDVAEAQRLAAETLAAN